MMCASSGSLALLQLSFRQIAWTGLTLGWVGWTLMEVVACLSDVQGAINHVYLRLLLLTPAGKGSHHCCYCNCCPLSLHTHTFTHPTPPNMCTHTHLERLPTWKYLMKIRETCWLAIIAYASAVVSW